MEPSRKSFMRPGTNLYALICGAAGVAVALLALTIGFWKTLLIVAFFAAGYALGKFGVAKRLIDLFTGRFKDF